MTIDQLPAQLRHTPPDTPAALVTGGAGFIGSHLVDALVARGERVVVLDNLHRGRADFIAGHLSAGDVTLIEGDIRNEDDVARAMEGARIVYHLAAQSNVLGAMQDGSYSFTTNVVGTHNVLRAAVAAGAERVVFSSSREVYGDAARVPVPETDALAPKNPYGASKVAGEAYCRAMRFSHGLDVAILRFANVYGPRDTDRVIPRWLDRAREGRPLSVFGGKQILDFIHIDLAVRALLHAGDHGLDEPVNIGSGTGTNILDLAERIRAVTGTTSEVELLAANDCEVVAFVASVERMRALGIEPPADPLAMLSSMAATALAGVRA